MRFCSSKKTGAKKPFRDLHLKGFVFVLTRLYMKELTSGRLSLAEKIVETTMYTYTKNGKKKQTENSLLSSFSVAKHQQ